MDIEKWKIEQRANFPGMFSQDGQLDNEICIGCFIIDAVHVQAELYRQGGLTTARVGDEDQSQVMEIEGEEYHVDYRFIFVDVDEYFQLVGKTKKAESRHGSGRVRVGFKRSGDSNKQVLKKILLNHLGISEEELDQDLVLEGAVLDGVCKALVFDLKVPFVTTNRMTVGELMGAV